MNIKEPGRNFLPGSDLGGNDHESKIVKRDSDSPLSSVSSAFRLRRSMRSLRGQMGRKCRSWSLKNWRFSLVQTGLE